MCNDRRLVYELSILMKGKTMIPKNAVILLGFMNTKLRDQYENLEDLCDDLECNRKEIELKLESIDYRYNKKENQFR